jgi:hypothetical protein
MAYKRVGSRSSMTLRRSFSLLFTALALAAALGTAPVAAAASVSSRYALTGYEYYATSTRGRFAGSATGNRGDTATWNAVVDHTALTTAATITGGSATLATSRLVVISGTFTGGSVELVDQPSGCGIQRYAVNGTLGNVTRSDRTRDGTGTFAAILTHYRVSVLGSCTVYSASVTGTISLNF